MSASEYDSGSSYEEQKRKKRKVATIRKTAKTNSSRTGVYTLSLDPLLYPPGCNIAAGENTPFEQVIEELLPDLFQARTNLQARETIYDEEGSYLRPLTRSEVSSFVDAHDIERQASHPEKSSIIRKLKLVRERRRAGIPHSNLLATGSVSLHRMPVAGVEPKEQVLNALQRIQSTPYENSFLSRLQGSAVHRIPGLLAVDWNTSTPWMSLMQDIRDHYGLSHFERDQPKESTAPIAYMSLRACHLNQVHDLLERVFWTGINVGDALEYSPEKCTVVATYKQLVVGVAIMSSPQETYITYLAVKAGWDKTRIARMMLYLLIKLNPQKDITLHVSANNSAMLLYNQFGFKAEEFIANFYEDYLDPASRASKNAFRLRLRQ